MAHEGSISLTDDTVQVKTGGGNFEKKPAKIFKPEEGKTYRIRFTSGDVMMRLRHFNPMLKKYYRCLSFQGFCPCCIAANNKVNNIKRASETYGANIMVYDANPDGSPVEPLNGEIYFWAFGSDKFVQLRGIIREWGAIEGIDLQLTCTDSQFQKVTMNPMRKCWYNESGDLFKNACDAKLEKDKYPLDKFICKEVNLQQMVEAFGLDESYLPAEIKGQMGDNLAQNRAAESPKQEVSTQQVATNQATTATAAPADNFASLDNISTLL